MKTRDLHDILRNWRSRVPPLRKVALPLTLLAVVFILVATSVYGCLRARAFRRPVSPNRLEVIGFYENPTRGLPGSEESLRNNIRFIDTVVPFWASVDPNGNITAVRSEREIVDFAHQNDRPIIVLLNNVKPVGVINWASIETPEIRTRTTANIASFVRLQGYDGAHINFDLMAPAARSAFSAFVQDLARELHQANKILGVSVYPPVELPASLWGAYDYAAIGRHADYVVLQAFERHSLNTAPGPIAPDPWVESGLQKVLAQIPARKLVLGIGAYGYDWAQRTAEGTTEYLSARTAIRRADETGATIRVDRRSNQPTYNYTISETARVVWFQDATSIRSKLGIARKYGLRGVALWRLGLEEEAAWRVISQHARR